MKPLAPFAAALLAATPAGASAEMARMARMAVAPLEAPPHLRFTAQLAADVIAREAKRLGAFEVTGPIALEARVGRKRVEALADCGQDATCVGRVAERMGFDQVVSGTLYQAGSSYRVAVVLVDPKISVTLASFKREVPVASRRLMGEIASATPALLRRDPDQEGVLLVTSNAPQAEVVIDGKPAGRTPMTQVVRPGKHRVQVTSPGYMQQVPHWVHVPPGTEITDAVKLYPFPAAGAPGGKAATSVEVSR